MESAISDFFSGRKTERIKKKCAAIFTVAERNVVEQETEQEFLLNNWLPLAAQRAKQLSLTSHPCKFSHPDAKTSAIIAEGKKLADGFLRTGNTESGLDVLGNAAAMDVFKFLSLRLSDERSILEHLELSSEKIQNELKIVSATFEELRTAFLSIKKTHEAPITHEKVKQVYFPVTNNYHLLSILTPSGLVFELRKRIDRIRFSEGSKEAKEHKRKNIHNNSGYDDLFGLTMIGYGGTKPQNISVLNSTYGGKAYLLSSIPAVLIKQNHKPPKNDFFTNTLWPNNFKDDFQALNKLFIADHNNKNIRDGRDRRIQIIINNVIELMWLIRGNPAGWSENVRYTNLSKHQKIWLDEARAQERLLNDDWRHEIISEFARWFIHAYKKLLGNKAIPLADLELTHINSIIENNKDDLI